MPLAGVIFDFDGVLADSEPLHLRAYQEVLAPRGIALSTTDYYDRYLVVPVKQIATYRVSVERG